MKLHIVLLVCVLVLACFVGGMSLFAIFNTNDQIDLNQATIETTVETNAVEDPTIASTVVTLPPETMPFIENTTATEPVEETQAIEMTEPSIQETVQATEPIETVPLETDILMQEELPVKDGSVDYPGDGEIVYTNHWVNVRSKPNLEGKIVGRIEEGLPVFRHETKNTWSKIQFDGNKIGYISDKYLDKEKTEKFKLYDEVDEYVYSGHDVNMRTTPNGMVIGKLPQGESIRRIGIGQNGWSQCVWKDQLVYINNLYLGTDPDFKIPLEFFIENQKKPQQSSNSNPQNTQPPMQQSNQNTNSNNIHETTNTTSPTETPG